MGGRDDYKQWTMEKYEIFSVKSLYCHLQGGKVNADSVFLFKYGRLKHLQDWLFLYGKRAEEVF